MEGARLAWCLMAVLALTRPAYAAYCEKKEAKSGDPALPNFDDVDSFTVDVRATIIDKQYTMLAKEYYDSTQNLARMDTVKDGLQTGLVIDYTNNTYVLYSYFDQQLKHGECNIYELDKVKDQRPDDDNLELFKWRMQPKAGGGSAPHIMTTAEILQISKNIGEEYVGETDIEGVIVDHWQSCMTWTERSATFTVDYYFTKPDSSSWVSQVPVKAEVQGKIEKGGKSVDFHHVYQYLDFRPLGSHPELFSLPDFLVCQGANSTWLKGFPPLPESMSYTVEKISHDVSSDGDKTTSVSATTVYHDARRRLVRVDQGRSTSISDFNTGVEFLIDDNGCVQRKIDPDNVPSAVEERGVVKMGDRPEIRYLRGDFFYSGLKVFRDGVEDAFVSKKDDEIVQAYASHVFSLPLGVKVWSESKNVTTQYHLFAFRPHPNGNNKNPFDLGKCLGSDGIFDIRPGYKPSRNLYQLSRGEEVCRSITAEMIGVSPLQVSCSEYIVDVHLLYCFINFYSFDETVEAANVENKLDRKTYETIKTQRMFLNDRTFNFEDLDVTFNLYSISFDFDDVSEIRGKDMLYDFHKTEHQCVKEFTLDLGTSAAKTAHECAEACVALTSKSCNIFQYIRKAQSCHMGLEQGMPDTTDSPGCAIYMINNLRQFRRKGGAVVVKKDDNPYHRSETVEDCATLCLEEGKFTCNSFDFCDSEKRCQLYEDRNFQDVKSPGNGEESDDCYHYQRYIGNEFTRTSFSKASFEGQVQIRADSNTCWEMCYDSEDGCAMISHCFDSNGKDTCTLVPVSKVKEVTLVHDENCRVYKAKSIRRGKRVVDASMAGQIAGSYSGGAMFGLAMAMLLTGLGVGGLTYFFLRHFQVWEGFQ